MVQKWLPVLLLIFPREPLSCWQWSLAVHGGTAATTHTHTHARTRTNSHCSPTLLICAYLLLSMMAPSTPDPKPATAEIAVSDIVDYAQRISGITAAPSYWKPGMAMVGFAPPAPRPEMMRAGALSAFAVTTGELVG